MKPPIMTKFKNKPQAKPSYSEAKQQVKSLYTRVYTEDQIEDMDIVQPVLEILSNIEPPIIDVPPVIEMPSIDVPLEAPSIDTNSCSCDSSPSSCE